MEVTIVLPTYNGEKFLETALHSISCQSYKNFNVVISDDGSTDRTLGIVKDFYHGVDFPVYILEHDRLGLVENWNHGIQFVQQNLPDTKYIKFLFQDDILTSDCLEVMVALARKNCNLGMLFGRRFLIGELDRSLFWLMNISTYWLENANFNQSELVIISPKCFHNSNFFAPPDNKIGEPTNVLIPMQTFDRVGLFDPQFKQYCDLEMWLRIMANSNIGFIDRELAGFRIHPHQTTWQNQKNDRVWSEIYAVWYKVVCHSVYDNLPRTVKNRIFDHVYQELVQQCFRICKYWRFDRFPTILYWSWQFIYARLVLTP